MAKEKETKGELQPARKGGGLTPFDEFERFFENAFPRGWLRQFGGEWPDIGGLMSPLESRTPKVDIVDRDDEILVRADVAGVKKEDIDVSLSEGSVTIRGTVGHEEKEEHGDYYRREITRGAFSRTLPLPGAVNEDKARAEFKEGILELHLPKAEKAKRKTIKVE